MPDDGSSSPTLAVAVGYDEVGSRLDQLLVSRLEDRTRSFVRRLIVGGYVHVDGEPATKAGLRVEAGMRIEVRLPEAAADQPLPESIPLTTVYEDEDLLVIDKPAGLVVHPGHGRRDGTLVNALLGRGTPLASAGAPDRPGIVHRLDQGTSGLIAVAKNDLAYRSLSEAFAERRVRKRYKALVWGRPDPPSGRIERRIARSRTNRTIMEVTGSRGREAVSHYRTLESPPGFALLDVAPETGRTHQIRVHLQSIHHPIVGDERYGGRAWRGLQDPTKRVAVRDFERLALHAASLAFAHPASGEPLRFEASIPPEFEALLEILRQSPERSRG